MAGPVEPTAPDLTAVWSGMGEAYPELTEKLLALWPQLVPFLLLVFALRILAWLRSSPEGKHDNANKGGGAHTSFDDLISGG